jgi:TolA-binding protein
LKVSHKKIVVLAVVLLLLGAAFFLVPRKRSISSYVNRAEEAFHDKEFNRAIELYLQALKFYPNHERVPDILLTVGDIYNFSLGNTEKAGKAYQMVSEKFPKSLFSRRARQSAAEMYEKNQQYQKALLAYQGIVDSFPQAGDADDIRYKVAVMALKLKKYEPARRSLMAIIETNPNTPIADKLLNQIGSIFFMEGASHEAVQVLTLAIKKYPDSPYVTEMKFTLANAYEEMGEIKKALEIYGSIIKDYPNPQVVQNKIDKIKDRRKEQKKFKAQIQDAKRKTLATPPGKPKSKSKTMEGIPELDIMKNPKSLNNADGALTP